MQFPFVSREKYKDILSKLEFAETKILNKNEIISQISNEVKRNEEDVSKYLNDIENYKKEILELNKIIDKLEEKNQKSSKKLKAANGRIGGYVKRNNELQEINYKQKNIIDSYKKKQIKLTPNQYDKKLKPKK